MPNCRSFSETTRHVEIQFQKPAVAPSHHLAHKRRACNWKGQKLEWRSAVEVVVEHSVTEFVDHELITR